MKRRSPIQPAALLILLAPLAGCARSVPPPLPPADRQAAAALLESSAAEAGRVRRYQSIIEVRGEGPRGRFSAELLIVFQRPAGSPDPSAVERLRMEALGWVRGPRWVLVAVPGRVTAVVPSRRAFAEGARLDAFTGSLLGVAVSVREVAAMLSGTGAPLRADDRFRWRGSDGLVLLGDGSRVLWDRGRVARAVAPGYEIRYARRGAWPPREFEVRSPRITASLAVVEIRVNAELHPDSFVLGIPADFRRVQPGDLGGAEP